jgi:hypothetical protein
MEGVHMYRSASNKLQFLLLNKIIWAASSRGVG